jgi:hypothetical protein
MPVVPVGSVVIVEGIFSGFRALAMLEVKKFSIFSDCSIHEEGDEVLVESVSELERGLSSTLRSHGRVVSCSDPTLLSTRRTRITTSGFTAQPAKTGVLYHTTPNVIQLMVRFGFF